MDPRIDALLSQDKNLFKKSQSPIENFSNEFSLKVQPTFNETPRKRKFQVPSILKKRSLWLLTKHAKVDPKVIDFLLIKIVSWLRRTVI